MIDEVCNVRSMPPHSTPESFHRFKYETMNVDPGFMLEPTADSHREFVRAYLARLAQLSSPRNAVVDIKYGHVFNFEAWWWPMTARPYLLEFCESNDIGVIHLFRENVVEAIASGLIANQRSIWHAWEEGADRLAGRRYVLPVQELVTRARNLEVQKTWFRRWMLGVRHFELSYERLAAELGRGGELDATLASLVGGAQLRPFTPRHRKITEPLRDVVENYEELRSACDRAGLGSFLG